MTLKDMAIACKFKELVEQSAHVHHVIVFGSRVRRDSSPDSDMDVMIVVEERTPEIENHISECAWEAGFGENVIITTVVYSMDEFNNSPERASVFVETVLKEGIVV